MSKLNSFLVLSLCLSLCLTPAQESPIPAPVQSLPLPSPTPSQNPAEPQPSDPSSKLNQPSSPSDNQPTTNSDTLTAEPAIPAELIAPIQKPIAPLDRSTIESSQQTLRKLQATAKPEPTPKPEKYFTIQEAIAFALNHNPNILSALENIRQASGQYISLRAQLLPHFIATPAYTIVEQSLAGAAIRPGVPPPQNRFWSFQLSLNQLLFDSGASYSATKSAKFQEKAAYFLLRKTIDETIAAVKTNFYQIILNRALIAAQEQSVALLQSQLQDQINRYEAGVVPRFNVLQAEVALANAIPPLIQARNNLRIAQYQFIRLLGMDYDTANPASIPVDVKGDLDVPYREINTEESIRTALIRNPQLKAQRFDILAQVAQVNVALAGYGPKVSARVGYEWQNDRTSRDLGDILDGWFLGIQASWNLFDSFLTAGQVKQAKARLRQSKALYDNAVREVILQVQEAISNLTEARQTIESQKANVTQALEALRLARERLDAGAGTQLDVLNAQTSLLQAQTTLLQAKFSYISALAHYDAALSLDTQWLHDFNDPLENPEKRRLIRTNLDSYQTPPLPREFRNSDPLQTLLPSKS